MSSPTISGRYALYKAGTNRVVRWLTTTAGSNSDVRNYDPLGRITTPFITACANAITKANVKVPANVLELLLDVITGRRICADWYSTKAAERHQPDSHDKEESDKSHRHFIGVLQNVYDVLKASRSEWRANKTPSEAKCIETRHTEPEAKESLSNIFAQLELEEPEETAPGATSPKQRGNDSTPVKNTNASIVIDENAEKQFALWCFLEDLAEVRAFVRQTWQEYADGEVSLLLACNVTDTAFGVMRRSETTFLETQSELGYLPQVFRCLNSKIGDILENKSDTLNARTIEDCESIHNPSELLSSLATFALYHLHRLWDVVDELPARSPMPAPSDAADGNGEDVKVEAPEPEDSWLELVSYYCSYHRFAKLLAQHVIELSGISKVMAETGDTMAPLDEFGDSLFAMRRGKGFSMWNISACQSYIELLDIIRYKREAGLNEMERTALASRAVTEQYMNFMGQRKTQVGQSKAHAWRLQIHSNVMLMESMKTALFNLGDESGDAGLTGKWPHTIFRDLPVQSGVTTLACKRHMLYMGIRVINDHRYILDAAHIYRAARHYHILEPWPDMDYFMKLHHTKSPVVREIGPSTDPLVLEKHYELAIGVPLTKLGGNGRNRLTTHDLLRNHKYIPAASDFLYALRDRIDEDRQLGCQRGEVIEVVLKSMRERQLNVPGKTQARRSFGQAPSEVTGMQLLQTYKELLITDEPELNFDYISFWIACVQLVETIKIRVNHQLPAHFRNDPTNIGLVGGMLFEAAGCQRTSTPVESSPLGTAADILKEYIVAEGGKFSIAALEQSSGHIPEHNRPFAGTKSNEGGAGIPSLHGTKETMEQEVAPQAKNDETATCVTHSKIQVNETASTPVGVRKAYAARRNRGRRLLRSRK